MRAVLGKQLERAAQMEKKWRVGDLQPRQGADLRRAHNGPDSVFPIANAMADSTIRLGWRRFAKARKTIIEQGLVIQVAPQTRHRPAFYRWPMERGRTAKGTLRITPRFGDPYTGALLTGGAQEPGEQRCTQRIVTNTAPSLRFPSTGDERAADGA